MSIFTPMTRLGAGSKLYCLYITLLLFFSTGLPINSFGQDTSGVTITNYNVSPTEIIDSTTISLTVESNSKISYGYLQYSVMDSLGMSYYVGSSYLDTIDNIFDVANNVLIPYNIPGGGYDFFTYYEFYDEFGNFYSYLLDPKPITILSDNKKDLSISYYEYYSPRKLFPGIIQPLSYLVEKTGRGSIDSAEVNYFLSKDSVFNIDSSVSIGKLNRNLNYSYSSQDYVEDTIRIPSDFPHGNYFLHIVTDVLNKVTETNESNNISTSPVVVEDIIADIAVTTADIYPSGTWAYVSVSLTNTKFIENTSQVFTFPVGYFLSNDSVLDDSDLFVGQSNASWYSYSQYTSTYFAFEKPQGSAYKYVLTVADYLNDLEEGNESDNIVASRLSSDLDLSIITPVTPAVTVTHSHYLQVSTFIKNSGSATIPSSFITYSIFDPYYNPVVNEEYYLDSIEIGDIKESVLNIYLPYEGVFILKTSVDSYNYITEFNEDNNYSEQKIVYFTSTITGTEDGKETNDLTIAPSPAQEQFTISNHKMGSDVNYTLYNSLGEQVWNAEKVSAENTAVSCQNWSKGIYILKAEIDGQVSQKKVVIY